MLYKQGTVEKEIIEQHCLSDWTATEATKLQVSFLAEHMFARVFRKPRRVHRYSLLNVICGICEHMFCSPPFTCLTSLYYYIHIGMTKSTADLLTSLHFTDHFIISGDLMEINISIAGGLHFGFQCVWIVRWPLLGCQTERKLQKTSKYIKTII